MSTLTLSTSPITTSSSFDEEWGEWHLTTNVGDVQFYSSWVEVMDEGDDDEDIPSGEILLTGLECSSPGSGKGDLIIQHLKSWAKAQGFHTISLTPGGEHLESFYKRGGWIPPKEPYGHWKCKL